MVKEKGNSPEGQEYDFLVLVVDDDADTRAIVGSTLSALGLRVREASAGQEALTSVQEHHPDIVVLDWMMPGMSGDEVCREIRGFEGGDLIPIIMLTARDSLKDKVSALEGGADDYVTKPFEYRELQARVRAQLRIRQLNLALQRKNEELQEMHKKLIEQERQLAVGQLAGTAAHELGQPLSAILLNCHLIGSLEPEDEKFERAVANIKADAKKMAELIASLKKADAANTASYHKEIAILALEKEEP